MTLKITTVRTLLEMLDEIILDDASWIEKRTVILSEATDSDKANLEEFSAWFDITTTGEADVPE